MEAPLRFHQMAAQLVEHVQAFVEIDDLLGDQREEPKPDVTTHPVLPYVQEGTNPSERKIESLGSGDEPDPLFVVVVVCPVPARRPTSL